MTAHDTTTKGLTKEPLLETERNEPVGEGEGEREAEGDRRFAEDGEDGNGEPAGGMVIDDVKERDDQILVEVGGKEWKGSLVRRAPRTQTLDWKIE